MTTFVAKLPCSHASCMGVREPVRSAALLVLSLLWGPGDSETHSRIGDS